jgi:hypothetical protein
MKAGIKADSSDWVVSIGKASSEIIGAEYASRSIESNAESVVIAAESAGTCIIVTIGIGVTLILSVAWESLINALSARSSVFTDCSVPGAVVAL